MGSQQHLSSGHSLIVLLDLLSTSVLSDLLSLRGLDTHTVQLRIVSQSHPFFMLDENLRANPFSCQTRTTLRRQPFFMLDVNTTLQSQPFFILDVNTTLRSQPFFMLDVKTTHLHRSQPFFMLDDEITYLHRSQPFFILEDEITCP